MWDREDQLFRAGLYLGLTPIERLTVGLGALYEDQRSDNQSFEFETWRAFVSLSYDLFRRASLN